MLVKVCGMKYKENIVELCKADIDLIGFIFYKGSKRYVDMIPVDIPETIKKVGVFVNENPDDLLRIVNANELDFVQLHGDEDESYCSLIKGKAFQVIKAFRLGNDFNFNPLNAYESVADFFLFDTKGKTYGGTGRKFNRSLLHKYKGSVPFFLSGGINEKDHAMIKSFAHSKLVGIDINSRFETEPALKDIEKINTFILNLKNG